MQVPTAYLLLLLMVRLLRAAEEEKPQEKPKERSNRILDHIITTEQATQAAVKFDLAKLGVSDEVGCGQCSLQERMYCVSESVLSDHCCCDKHLEPMPFVPHRCYIKLPPAAPCMPIAGNCAQYSRVFDCCCKHILQQRFPSRPTHNTWLTSALNLMGIKLSEREVAVDPVPPRPDGAPQPSVYRPFPSYVAGSSAESQSNFSYTLSDDITQFLPFNKSNLLGHNKLVSGAHVPRGGLVALLATLALRLFR